MHLNISSAKWRPSCPGEWVKSLIYILLSKTHRSCMFQTAVCNISHSTIRPCYDDTQLYCVHQKSEIMTQVQWSYIDALVSPSLVWLRNWTFLIPQRPQQMPWGHTALDQIDALVQEGRNSIASAMELRLSCTNLSIWHLPKLVCL